MPPRAPAVSYRAAHLLCAPDGFRGRLVPGDAIGPGERVLAACRRVVRRPSEKLSPQRRRHTAPPHSAAAPPHAMPGRNPSLVLARSLQDFHPRGTGRKLGGRRARRHVARALLVPAEEALRRSCAGPWRPIPLGRGNSSSGIDSQHIWALWCVCVRVGVCMSVTCVRVRDVTVRLRVCARLLCVCTCVCVCPPAYQREASPGYWTPSPPEPHPPRETRFCLITPTPFAGTHTLKGFFLGCLPHASHARCTPRR